VVEMLDVVERHVLVAQKIERGIEQHRAMPGREHEPVAVGPVGRLGIELHHLGEQHGGDIGAAHGQAGMSRIGGLHGVHGKGADGVGHCIVFGSVSHGFPEAFDQEKAGRRIAPGRGPSRVADT
jgi:hypothetical protein